MSVERMAYIVFVPHVSVHLNRHQGGSHSISATLCPLPGGGERGIHFAQFYFHPCCHVEQQGSRNSSPAIAAVSEAIALTSTPSYTAALSEAIAQTSTPSSSPTTCTSLRPALFRIHLSSSIVVVTRQSLYGIRHPHVIHTKATYMATSSLV